MPDLKTKQELATAAERLATSLELVQRANTTYVPVDWQTLLYDPPPQPGERIWFPLDREDKRILANTRSNILFYTDAELKNFEFMLKQWAIQENDAIHRILVRTPAGLMQLNSSGMLVPHDDSFTPNYVTVMLNTDAMVKKEVFDTIAEWVGGEDAAHSLLHHLATALAPGFSAVKYVILIGDGRNGKGVLLAMLTGLFGAENISNVTRQMMAEASPTCVELNNKLLNVVFDGEMAYIKDSAMEKTLIAGEPGYVRMLYESGTTKVQTNALFIEALNTEPKARDKSSALQKRLVRFRFPNVYAVDYDFHDKMTSEPYLGALLALLIDHYVQKSEIATKLALTQSSLELQMEQVWLGSPVLQFLEQLDAGNLARLEAGKMPTDVFLASFKPWAETQGLDRSDSELVSMMQQVFNIERKGVRAPGAKNPTTKRVITSLKPETVLAIEQMRGDTDAAEAADEAVVGD